MKKIIKILACLITSLMIFTSCIPKNIEINSRLIIEAIGIDWEDEKYKVSLQVLETSNTGEGSSNEQSGGGGTGSGGKYTRIYELEGKTLSLAIQESTFIEGKRPLYSHNRILIIGREAADKKLMDIIDFMSRSNEMRYTVSTAVYDGKAVDVLKADDGTTISAETIEKALKSGKINVGIPHVTVFDLARSLYNGESGQYIPLVSLQKGNDGKYTDVRVSNAALFGEKKLKCFLNENETYGIVWINEKIRDGIFEIKLENGQGVALKIISSKAQIKTKTENNQPKFTIKLKCKCYVNEKPWQYSNLTKSEVINSVREISKEQIYNDICAAINKCIYENNCDVFRLLSRLSQNEREYYKKNMVSNKYDLTNAIFDVKVDVEIRHIV